MIKTTDPSVILSHSSPGGWTMHARSSSALAAEVLTVSREWLTIEIREVAGVRTAVTYVQSESILGAMSEPFHRHEYRTRPQVHELVERVIAARISHVGARGSA